MNEYGHWNIDIVGEFDISDYIGYVYEIENLSSGKKYIGKKLLVRRKTKVSKGKKKRLLVESDWKTYCGSNKELLEDIENLGEEKFKFTILRLCESKGVANYYETKEILVRDALLSEDYYNSWIAVKVSRSHLNAKNKKK